MSEINQYSDEHISAYIDGELDNEERARLLFDEQQDSKLAQRISDARTLKEKVQLAYADIPSQTNTKTFSCTAFVSKRWPLVAGISIFFITAALTIPAIINHHDITLAKNLIKITPAISSEEISTVAGDQKKVLINLTKYHAETFDTTINHIETLLLQHENDKTFSVEIVASKNGLKALDTKSSNHAEHISLLAKRYKQLNIVACTKSLADLASSGNPVKLMKDVFLAPSAASQIAKRMNDGWIYIKL